MTRLLDALLWPLGLLSHVLIGMAFADALTGLNTLASLMAALQ